MFQELGVPVYIADIEARKLTNRSKVIKRKLISLLGQEAFEDGELNRTFVANKVFKNSKLLEQLNSIIHPKVAAHFERWKKKQQFPYCIKEAAILFENGSYSRNDLNILVVAPLDVRIRRLKARDNSTLQEIESRMSNQWSDDKKKELADIILLNTDLEQTRKRVAEIHNMLINKA